MNYNENFTGLNKIIFLIFIADSQRNISGCVNNNRVIILLLMLHKAELYILLRNVSRMFDLEEYVYFYTYINTHTYTYI